MRYGSSVKRQAGGLPAIHAAVLLFGLAGLFGRFLALPPVIIVLGRTFFAGLALGLLLVVIRSQFVWPAKGDFVKTGLLGALLAIHWVGFFQAIQLSSVAVGLITFSTFPLFVTFLEPFFFKHALRFKDVLTAVTVVCGLILVVPTLDSADHVTQGACWGVFAGFTFAVLSLLNRRLVVRLDPLFLAAVENVAACLCLLPFGFMLPWQADPVTFLWLAVLGVFCTALAHALFISGLQTVRAQLASIIAGLEPVYGTLLAFVLLSEKLALRTMAGGVVIVGAVMLATYRRKP